ncbi:hypothetical protein ACSPAH_02615 [Buttiauxella agrestis]
MKDLVGNYREIAERSSGCLALSVMHSYLLVVFVKKIMIGSLALIDLIFLLFVVAMISFGLIVLARSITMTIHEVIPTLLGRVAMYFLYYPVFFGVIFMGIATAGVQLKY